MLIGKPATHRYADVESENPHGVVCDCVALTAALGMGSGSVSFHYCRNVLQQRWSMVCRHGEKPDRTIVVPLSETWKDKGELNPVLAILIKNA